MSTLRRSDVSAAPSTDVAVERRVAVVTLGCARNEVDSEELAGRLEAGGFTLVADPVEADAVLVNTCGFVETAKKDSVDTLLQAADLKQTGQAQSVVAVGCLAERYGVQLAEALPEADAVLGFDDYPDIAARLRGIVAGAEHVSHEPRDRRSLLPLAPVQRSKVALPSLPGHASSSGPASGPRPLRRRLAGGPVAPLKLASGCDRRCSFCAIPSFRGSFLSRPPADIVAEAGWLAADGVREVVLVSENSTSYGKDLGDLRLLESLLPALAAIDGIRRVRISYLQPAEMRSTLIGAMASTPGVAQYFDLSFQHAAGTVLRRMRRFGDAGRFLKLLTEIRAASPRAGIRSNFIVGFPGETSDDLQTLCDFLVEARLDAVGVFGYSDEDGTAAVELDGHHDAQEIAARAAVVVRLAEELTVQRAEDRLGETVDVLLETVTGDTAEGRPHCQGPDVDGSTALRDLPRAAAVGDIVAGVVTGSDGVDLIASAVRCSR